MGKISVQGKCICQCPLNICQCVAVKIRPMAEQVRVYKEFVLTLIGGIICSLKIQPKYD
jgi:hypothetical protein